MYEFCRLRFDVRIRYGMLLLVRLRQFCVSTGISSKRTAVWCSCRSGKSLRKTVISRVRINHILQKQIILLMTGVLSLGRLFVRYV